MDVVNDSGVYQISKNDVDNVADEMCSWDVVGLMTKFVDEVVADLEEDKVMNQVDLDVVEVMDDQGLLVEVERCLEGTEGVTNPSDVGHDVDDDYHSFDGDVDVDLVLDAFLSLDERLLLDVYLDCFLGLGADELQSPTLDDYLDLDDVYVVDVELVLLALDIEVFDVVLLLYHDADVVENDDRKGQFPSC